MLLTDGTHATKGTKVFLTNPSKTYTIGPTNPLRGTEWECEGVVTGNCSVRWKNGSSNCYTDRQLSRVHVVEPGCRLEFNTEEDFYNYLKDRIVILSHPPSTYHIGKNNPAVGSPSFCTGVITKWYPENALVYVMWENGEGNCYKSGELSDASQFHQGICISIW
jgi:hypothetical protein